MTVELIEDPQGRRWLVDSKDGRVSGRVLIDDIGEVRLDEEGCWFVAGSLPPGVTKVGIDIPDADVTVGAMGWIAAIPVTDAERFAHVNFSSPTGDVAATRSIRLPAWPEPHGERLRDRVARLVRGGAVYGPGARD